MKLEDIYALIEKIDQSNIDEFEYEQEGGKIIIKKGSHPHYQSGHAPTQWVQTLTPATESKQEKVKAPLGQSQAEAKSNESPQADENIHKIESPMVGTFYISPSPDTDPYVKVGDHVNEDTVVCIVEAMKLFNEIEADQKGEIVEILAENGQLVEYGQPLFLLRKDA